MHIVCKKDKGFTLIELLVVVAIIGILAAVGVVAYNGYTSSAKKAFIKNQHSQVKKMIVDKWTHINLDSMPDIRILGNNCFLYFVPSNAKIGTAKSTNITDLLKSNEAIPTLCNHYPQGSEHTYYDWFWGIGFRNIHDQNMPAVVSPGRNNNLIIGVTQFACGANAGLSDRYSCLIKSRLDDSTYLTDQITKKN